MVNQVTGEINNLFKARQTILQILKRRGFDVSDYEGSSVSEVHSMFQNDQLDMIVKEGDTRKVYVKFHLKKNLRQNNIYDYVEDLFVGEVLSQDDDLIIIDSDDANDTVTKTLREIWSKEKYFITVLSVPRLQFNILDHEMVPLHVPLSEDQKRSAMVQYQVSDASKFAEISRFDPVAAVLGLMPGQLCEIRRPSRTAINALFLRICSP
jgi:DNA-directed RNA polymerase I, II, and III subunit RPABC1